MESIYKTLEHDSIGKSLELISTNDKIYLEFSKETLLDNKYDTYYNE